MVERIIVCVQSGVVSYIYSSAPVKITVVDFDIMEKSDPVEKRAKKAVHNVLPDKYFEKNDFSKVVNCLIVGGDPEVRFGKDVKIEENTAKEEPVCKA